MADMIVKKAVPSMVDKIVKLDEGDPETVYRYNRKSVTGCLNNESAEKQRVIRL